MNITAFYNKYPYPNTQIKTVKDLDKLNFQKKLLKTVQKYIKSGKVLEIGCGTGEMSLLLAKHGFEVSGSDISQKSIIIAQGLSKRLNLKVNFSTMDILQVNTKTQYDLTLANGVLHHTVNPHQAYLNMLKLTKKQGIICLVLYTKIGLLIRKITGKLFSLATLKKILPSKFRKMTDSVLIDAFYNPYERAFCQKEILDWFKKEGVKLIGYQNLGNVFIILGKQQKARLPVNR